MLAAGLALNADVAHKLGASPTHRPKELLVLEKQCLEDTVPTNLLHPEVLEKKQTIMRRGWRAFGARMRR